MIVRVAPDDHLPWLAERAQIAVTPTLRALEAVDADGRIHGMVGLDGWTPAAVVMHVALDHPAALRSLVRPGFNAAFLACGRLVALAPVVSTNARSLALVPRLGFRLAYRIRDGWAPGVDMHWFEMRRDECPWIRADQRRAA